MELTIFGFCADTRKEWRREPERGDDYSLKQATSSLDFWLLVITMACSMGSGTTAIDNMGQIGASLGYSQVNINTFISLISIWNFLGRFGAGVVSELLLHTKNISRPCCLALSLVRISQPTLLTHFLLGHETTRLVQDDD